MEGSSDSSWRRSNNSRNLYNSSSSNINPRVLRGITIGSSADSQDCGTTPVRKNRERTLWPHINNYRIRTGGSGVDDVATIVGPAIQPVESNDVSLRQWLDDPKRTVDAFECLHIYSQIVEIVNSAHSRGIVVHYVRPSCFVMSSFNRVSFIESGSCFDLGENGLNDQTVEYNKGSFPVKEILVMESNWYMSPEEVAGGPGSCASDIYRLGVLLFELFHAFGSSEEKSATMASLRHRLLPPQLLLKWPKQASFCLWLLYPEPSSRPKMSELLQSDFLNEPRDDIKEREAATELRETIDEQELLLEFLLLMQQRKLDSADSLREAISHVSSDIEEVTKLQKSLQIKPGLKSSHSINLTVDNDCGDSSGPRKRIRTEHYTNTDEQHQEGVLYKNSRLTKNFRKLESAYFSTRRRAFKPVSQKSGSISNVSSKKRLDNEHSTNGWINTFLEGLCKYLSYSKLRVKADLKQGDLLSSSNLVCSLSFDRDGEFFASAGVNKKIKVFECNSVLSGGRDIHYPVVEMASKSKLSSICWNGYIKSQIASSNFEGVVQIWDAMRGQIFSEMREHERRIWSVDFSMADPTMLASGSDDGTVKLWNINQGSSVCTINTKANICCVQFPTDSGRSIAFGSADHRIYYYDLRSTKMPLCTLVGHNKTVSYVKFVDSNTLVSASTDNMIKLWDLTACTSRVLDSPVQSFTGHLNVKNFVGLSVSEGFIATGSETNEVFVYHKAFPMPSFSFKFNNTDPLSGDEVDDSAQFISSVCWRGQSNTLVAANSMGNIKLLEMA